MTQETDEIDDWTAAVVRTLKGEVDQAIIAMAKITYPTEPAEIERRTRLAGTIARTAAAVTALMRRPARKARETAREEDQMSEDDRELTEAEVDGIETELFARVDHLVGAVERKSLVAGMGAIPAEGGAWPGLEGGLAGDALAERRTGQSA
ncbi:hypothetical protein [Brevundimonas faecalis]